MCPVCKEPFPHAELQDHHDKMHKLLPCKQCGESVCGTDLEDHIRDSCAHTMQTCKFCSLELRRGELPAHERYCGARTEQCEQCGEWVMMKYRQLHVESNHGFIRLEDDPPPFRRDKPTKVLNDWPKTTNGIKKADPINGLTTPKPTEIRYFQPSTSSASGSNINPIINPLKEVNGENRAGSSNGAIPRPKRTNDQPQINTTVALTNKVNKNMSISRGAIKKRPAPKPPVKVPAPDPKRDIPYYKAIQRQQEEERQRQEKNAQNLALGLPPVLSPLAKLEKLRKMDAVHNREVNDESYKNKLNGRVWMTPDIQPSGHTLGSENLPETYRNLEAQRRMNLEPERRRKENAPEGKNMEAQRRTNLEERRRKQNDPESSRNLEAQRMNLEAERRRREFKNLQPMTPEEFMERFNELQLKEPGERRSGDRFSQIKSSLRELRRGLNEVTAPYNSNPNAELNHNRNCAPPEEVRLPCEFCGEAVLLDDLVQHQTGCRPDLACIQPSRSHSTSPTRAQRPRSANGARARPARSASPPADPVIPCEFCAQSLPVYLISEHQERCGRESNMLFAD